MSFGEVDPQVRDLNRLLLPDADALGARMGERIRAEVAWYADNDVLDAAEVDRNCADNVRYVCHAHWLFERLIAHPALGERTLTISGDANGDYDWNGRARDLVARLV